MNLETFAPRRRECETKDMERFVYKEVADCLEEQLQV